MSSNSSHSGGDIVCDYSQIGALLKGSDVESMLKQAADKVQAQAGSGYVAETKLMGTRVIGSVETEDDNYEAMKDNAENNTLIKALGAAS